MPNPHFGIATDMMQFLSTESCTEGDYFVERTLGEFCQAHPRWGTPASVLSAVSRQLCLSGKLFYRGVRGSNWPFNEVYFSGWENRSDLNYKTFDHLAFGFPAIREQFISTVRPLVIEDCDGHLNVGTGFWFGAGLFATAAHCVLNKRSVKIDGWHPGDSAPPEVWVPTNPDLDIAIFKFDRIPPTIHRSFELRPSEILDRIMVMGYPKIPGFPVTLLSETAEVTAQTSLGEIVGQNVSYLGNQEYIVFSARVKGGSSGGPLIGLDGRVVGLVSSTPGGADGADPLGFGLAVPSQLLIEFQANCHANQAHARRLPVRPTQEGFSTSG